MAAEEKTAAKPLTLAQILSSLSYALDLTEGQPMGHSIKSCLIGMRIGADMGLTGPELRGLHYGLLMKDSGCSSNAARMYAIFGGDDLEAKRDAKIIDWCRLSEAVRFAIVHTLPTGSFMERAKRMFAMIGPPSKAMQAITQARCSRGSEIALELGLGEDAARAIYSLDEHWDGGGVPHGLTGEDIPVHARIACLAQTLEVFVTTFGTGPAFEVINTRRGKWFDPKIVDVANGFSTDAAFWETVKHHPHQAIASLNRKFGEATETDIDAV